MSKQKIWLVVALVSLLYFSGCGGGDDNTNKSTRTQITAIDGYIKDANITDKLGRKAIYNGSNGKYTFSSNPTYPITLNGGVLEDTNTTFDINMSISDGSSLIISPITTFIDNNSSISDKLTHAGFTKFNSVTDFAIDYIKENNIDMSKLAQLLYLVLRDNNLTVALKSSMTYNEGSLSNLFAKTNTIVNNSSLSSIEKSRAKSFLNAIKNYNGTAFDIESNSKIKAFKHNLINNNATIIYRGLSYGTIISPYTGRVWLDRNLGATKICDKNRRDGQFRNDTQYENDQKKCFGYYYQWGRGYDNHQESNSTTSNILASDINTTSKKFIQNNSSPYDWINNNIDDNGSLRISFWTKTDGSSICPKGFRVPTKDELEAETTAIDGIEDVTNAYMAFDNFLKLPSNGYRDYSSGNIINAGRDSSLWSASVSNTSISLSNCLTLDNGNAIWKNDNRANGRAVRCIKD
jgi:uncharacterized protein (TIGR02145 family)